jgi:hypothetical protein
MFNLFKRKTERERLEAKYRRLLAEAHRLSTSNRAASDLKRAEAEEVLKRMDLRPKDP